MLKILERLNEKREKEEAMEALRQIEHLFNVDIKNGKMYILCGSSAIAIIENNDKVNDVLASINRMRESAKAYVKG